MAGTWRGFEGWECRAMEYLQKKEQMGMEGLMVEGEWQEPGVVLKDGSLDSVG
jgi:hypothetical protein